MTYFYGIFLILLLIKLISCENVNVFEFKEGTDYGVHSPYVLCKNL